MQSKFQLRLVLLLAAFATFAVACASSSDDDDAGIEALDDDLLDDDPNGEASASCEDHSTILADADTESALLGLAATDVISAFGAGYSVTATYGSADAGLTQTPASGDTELTVSVTYDGGEVREIDSVEKEAEGDIQNEMAVICLDRLEVDVVLGFTSADGAFDESIAAVLSISVSMDMEGNASPMIRVDLDPSALSGSFSIDTDELGQLEVGIDSGSLQFQVEETSGTGPDATVSVASHVALSWGE